MKNTLVQFKFITEKNKDPERTDKIEMLMHTQQEESTHTGSYTLSTRFDRETSGQSTLQTLLRFSLKPQRENPL